jgi:hypothetical protein
MKVRFVLPLLFLGAAGHTSMVMAQSPGTFTATGNMAAPRSGHTAMMLTNSRVLIAGGAGPTAELYDPSTGTFAPTSNMTTARVFHIARLRLDSRGFFVGGQNDGSIGRASAELYDPSTGKFPWMRNMTHRTLPAHTVCNNVLRSTT